MNSVKSISLFSDYIKYKLIYPSLKKLVVLPRVYGINISSPLGYLRNLESSIFKLGATRPPRGFGSKKGEENDSENIINDFKKEEQASSPDGKKESNSTQSKNTKDNKEDKEDKNKPNTGENWNSKKSSKKSSNGSESDNKSDPDSETPTEILKIFGFGLIAAVGVSLLGSSLFWSGMGTETTFQEFCKNFLQDRKVQSIEIVNHNTYVLANTSSGHFYFKIGSVDSFERQFLLAQHDMNYSSDELIPVFLLTLIYLS